jgi:hypothetical protein
MFIKCDTFVKTMLYWMLVLVVVLVKYADCDGGVCAEISYSCNIDLLLYGVHVNVVCRY